MNKALKIIVMFVLLGIVGVFGAYSHYMEAEDFQANGSIVEARWNTKNHQMSLFRIREENGDIKTFHFSRVTLKRNEIKVGDIFIKKSKSTDCSINGKIISCVN